MDLAEAIRRRVRLVSGAGGQKRYLIHPLNGRFHPVDHDMLEALVRELAARIDVTGIACVLGFPEGGTIPAFAFSRAIGRPVLLGSRLPIDEPDTITFEQPEAGLGTTHRVHGLRPGARVIIVEDELTNGGMTVNAVRALRRVGVLIDHVATLLAIDHPRLWERMAAERLTLHVGARLSPDYAPRPLEAG
jgi:adenine/guanine phosphoribosyltransferase-like PRPP-binding protein